MLVVCYTTMQRDSQHVIDDLLLHEVDIEIEVSLNEPIDTDNLIRSVQVTSEWNNFREQLANDIFSEYLERHVELELK
jgi:hypothetical protein